MSGFKSYFPTAALYTPTTTMSAVSQAMSAASAAPAPSHGGFKHPAAGFMAPSKQEFGLDYFLKGALAGGICCSITVAGNDGCATGKCFQVHDPEPLSRARHDEDVRGTVQGWQSVMLHCSQKFHPIPDLKRLCNLLQVTSQIAVSGDHVNQVVEFRAKGRHAANDILMTFISVRPRKSRNREQDLLARQSIFLTRRIPIAIGTELLADRIGKHTNHMRMQIRPAQEHAPSMSADARDD